MQSRSLIGLSQVSIRPARTRPKRLSSPRTYRLTVQGYDSLPSWHNATQDSGYAEIVGIASQFGKFSTLWEDGAAVLATPNSYILDRGTTAQNLRDMQDDLTARLRSIANTAKKLFRYRMEARHRRCETGPRISATIGYICPHILPLLQKQRAHVDADLAQLQAQLQTVQPRQCSVPPLPSGPLSGIATALCAWRRGGTSRS